jgi:hypothetical protein
MLSIMKMKRNHYGDASGSGLRKCSFDSAFDQSVNCSSAKLDDNGVITAQLTLPYRAVESPNDVTHGCR